MLADGDREVCWAAEVDPAVPGHLAVQGQAGEAGGEALEGDGGLQPGQRCAQAVMGSRAEGDVLACVLAAEPELAGVRAPEVLVPVC